MAYLVICLVTMFAGFINCISGFGFGILSIGLFSLMVPGVTAVAVAGYFSVTLAITLAWANRKYINFRQLYITLPCSLFFGIVCVFIAGSIPESLFKRILGGVLLALAIYFLIFSEKIHFKPGPAAAALLGSASGILQGIFGMGGPPIVLYYLNSIHDKNEYMGTLQAYLIGMNTTVMVIRFMDGQLTADSLKYFLVALPAYCLTFWLARKLYGRLNDVTVRKFSYFCIAACGIYFLIRG